MATLTETFTNIANSIRLKTETTDKITPENMPAMIEGISVGSAAVVQELSITSNGTYRAPEGIDGYTPVIVNVPQDGSPPQEALVIKNKVCSYMFSGGNWDWFINQYGNQITTEGLIGAPHMFDGSNVYNIPFELNFANTYSSQATMDYMFAYCKYLKSIPKISMNKYERVEKMWRIFGDCQRLRELPEDIENYFNWEYMDTNTSSYGATNRSSMFYNCYSLRKIPMGFLNHGGRNENYSYCIFKESFYNCHCLDELRELPNPHYDASWGGSYSWNNAFDNTFYACHRLNCLTFKTQEDGTPYTYKWNYQIIDLSQYVGWASSSGNITGYNSGLTTATQITDDATYQALKDNPDSWTTDYKYSRYNKTSAIETINSLPDTSAYIAEKGNPNTIKFKGEAGSLTDGGAINTMTEEEIAVATAKGWTVSFV